MIVFNGIILQLIFTTWYNCQIIVNYSDIHNSNIQLLHLPICKSRFRIVVLYWWFFKNYLPPRAGNKVTRGLIPGEAYPINLFLPDNVKFCILRFVLLPVSGYEIRGLFRCNLNLITIQNKG